MSRLQLVIDAHSFGLESAFVLHAGLQHGQQ